jgi:predicted transglutaminase-like cysteine proteinase
MLKLRCLLFCLGISLLVGLWGCGSKASAKPTTSVAPVIKPGKGLFRSHEFRSTLKALPNWTRVLASAEEQTDTFYACNASKEKCSSAALSWQKIIKQSQGLAAMDQLKSVNKYFNRWPYGLDIDIYGVSDYWATPGEFLKLSGDCEDYSITKYYALRKLGFSVDDLRIVLLKDSIRNISHAVLAVKMNDTSYILDNVSWAHVAPAAFR